MAKPGTLKGILRIVVFCADVDRSRAWYESLGFIHARGYHGMHWLTVGTTEVMLHPAGGARDALGNRNPAIHVGVSDVGGMFDRAREAGYNPYDHQQPGIELQEPVTRPWGEVEFELDDPDGYRWAFTQAP